MATNVDKLREGLRNYNDSLDSHLEKLLLDFESLMGHYSHFRQEYEGQAAEEFKAVWEQTARWFEDYINITQSLSRTLEERIDSLNPV
jgi:uncharacterized protein YukE